MVTVINTIKLILLLCLGLLLLLGLGWLAVGPIIQGSLTVKKKDVPLLQEIPLILMSGLVINFGIVLCLQSLNNSLIVELIASSIGIVGFSIFVCNQFRQRINPALISKLIGMTFICLLFLSPILAEPLIDWDARSIWFFHAKMIYVAGSINQSAGWQHPSVGFSHPDYPILVPALAAQVAQVTGLWNEYLPKIALFFMLVPAIAWLFTFARRSFSFVILLLFIPFCFYPWIWNGYMDGLLAVYFSMALLLLGRYIRSSRPIDLVSSVCCFIALSYFKNEGALAALAGLASITLTLLWMKKTNSIKKFFSINWKYLIAVAIVLLPFVLWIFYKQQWNLTNDLSIGTKESFLRIYTRLMDGSYQRILHDVYQQVNGAVLLLGLLLFTSAAWKTKISRESLPALVAAGIYCLGIILIYLLTPNNLVWQLNTSVSRTLLCVNGGIFIGCYYLLNEIENRKKSNNDNNTHEIRSL